MSSILKHLGTLARVIDNLGEPRPAAAAAAAALRASTLAIVRKLSRAVLLVFARMEALRACGKGWVCKREGTREGTREGKSPSLWVT